MGRVFFLFVVLGFSGLLGVFLLLLALCIEAERRDNEIESFGLFALSLLPRPLSQDFY